MDAAIIDLDPRAQRGLRIAKSKGSEIRPIVDGKYFVPSEASRAAGYVVDITSGAHSCTCPDWSEFGAIDRAHRCKHYWAVLLHRRDAALLDGSVAVSVLKKTKPPRDWPRYNARGLGAGGCP